MSRTTKFFNTRVQTSRQAEQDGGFTLIELLIVIVILGVLAGIAIFAVGGFRSNAATACSNANTRINATVSAANSTGSGSTASATGAGPCT